MHCSSKNGIRKEIAQNYHQFKMHSHVKQGDRGHFRVVFHITLNNDSADDRRLK